MIVAEAGTATESLLARMNVSLSSGEATAIVISRTTSGSIEVGGAITDAQTVNNLIRDGVQQDWNAFTRDAFASVLGTLAGILALPAGPAAALAADIGMSEAFSRAYDSMSRLSSQQDWSGVFDWIEGQNQRANNAGFCDPSMMDIEGWTQYFDQAESTPSPIILDLDGDGVETTAVDSGAYFDHDDNGFAESTGWVGADDGLLVMDRDGDGVIGSGRELFGSETLLADGTKASNGFQALAELDNNGDGRIDSQDAAWSSLKIWRDIDGDGYSASQELLSLSDAGVQSIATGYADSTFVDASGNEHRQDGGFTRADGTTGAATDVWFKANPTRRLSLEWLSVPAEIAALPELRGLGNVYDLSQAMVRDASGELRGLVQSFVQTTDALQRNVLLEQILFKWTGAEGVDPASRGGHFDARKLHVLEAFAGRGYLGVWCWPTQDPNPHSSAAPILEMAYTQLFETYHAGLMLQTHLADLFVRFSYSWDDVNQRLLADYQPVLHQIQTDYAFNPAATALLVEETIRCMIGSNLYKHTIDFEEFIEGLVQLGPDVEEAIDSGLSIGLQGIQFNGTEDGDVQDGTIGADTLYGYSGNDILDGLIGNDLLDGGDGDDVLRGGSGADILDGGQGADYLSGGTGNDYLSGDNGADTYIFARGFGQDTIYDYDEGSGGNDIVRLAADIQVSEVELSRNDSDLFLKVLGTEDRITVTGFYSDPAQRIESVEFADGTVWDEAALASAKYLGTEGADYINGTDAAERFEAGAGDDYVTAMGGNDVVNGGAGSDTLDGGAGNDTLYGEEGNDYLYGDADNDTLDGGTGNDTLDGGDGGDTYLFARGFGQDTIYEYDQGSGGNDIVRFAADILPAEIELSRNESELFLKVLGTEDRITVSGYYLDPTQRIERIEFADGTMWDEVVLASAKYQGTEGADYINGTDAAERFEAGAGDDYVTAMGGNDVVYGGTGSDTLDGGGGNDVLYGEDGGDYLYGGAGDDTLDGGTGSDYLSGDDGADTYLFARGFGQDTIYEYDQGSGGNDIVRFAAGILPVEVELSRNESDLFLKVLGTEDRITVEGFYSSLAQRIERIEFADGTVWDEAALASAKYLGTEGADYINGTDAAERFEAGAGDDYVTAMGGNDVVNGGAGFDTLDGGGGNDVLYGEDGGDYLYGGAGDDTLDGGTGSDYLSGDDGADTYLFARGFGQDTIYEYDQGSGGNDIVRFAAGILPVEVELSRNESDLFLKVLGTEDRITVEGFYSSLAQRIERVEFADGTVWTSSILLAAKFVGTEGEDSIFGTTGNDRIEGRGGNDYLYGDAGADTLDGGTGNDQLDGGAGNDVYLFDRGYGQDTIYETSGTDTVRFEAGITAADVFVWRDDTSYYFDLIGTDDRLTVDNWYSGSAYRIENVEFADGTVWNSTILNGKTTTASEYADFYWGTASANTYDGLSGDDRIFGFGGNDTLRGGEGNDFIDGGIGNDIMIGGAGDDTYVVDSASDTVTELAGEGIDLVQASVTHTLAANVENLTLLDAGGAINGSGNELDNILLGNSSANILTGDAGNDWIEGGAGNDTLDGGIGADIMIGGAGSDTYVVDDAGDVVIELAGQGTDTVQSSFSYVLGDNLEKLTLTGTAAIDGTGNTLNNTLTGNAAANTLIGGAGDDSLNGGAGADTLIGGIGDDTYTVDNIGDVVVELEGEGNDTVRSSINWTLGDTLENLTLTGSANRIGTGNAQDNMLTGNTGSNTLYGLAGNDFVDGGTGADTLVGGIGNDTYVVDNAGDVVTENAGEGTDTVQASVTHTLAANVENLVLLDAGGAINGTGNALDNILTGNAANNTLNGGGGADTLIGGLGDDIYVVDALDTVDENAGEGIDTVQAGFTYTLGANLEKLTLTGSSAVNGYGNELDNTLTGNSAANVLAGGLGNDTYVIGATDTVVEFANEGTDTVKVSFSHTLAANVENLTLTGSSAINATGNELDNALTGNSGTNVLTGLDGNDWLDGKAGADTMLGGTGDDTYVVDNAGDIVTELADEGIDTVRSSRTYTLGANVENLLLTGSGAINGTGNVLDNVLTGNSGINILTGGAGNDTLDGKAGADTMLGGIGDDTYYVDNAGDVVTENADEGNDTVVTSKAYILGADLENLTLSGSSAIAGTGNAADNIIVGNASANTLWGREGDDILRGGGGADTLNGEEGDDLLDGGAGNDTLAGGVGNDTYWLSRGYGNDSIQENVATAGNTDVACFDTGIAVDQLWFRHVGNNLEVRIIGTTDKFTLQNWYSGSAYHVEQFRTADDRLLLDSQVENLVQAMAAFSPPASGQTTLPQNYQDALNPVIAANWQ
jgi:Ca2+-binding RTX toxin-like protein